MTTIGFLHTSAEHVERFRSLLTDLDEDLHEIHVVDAGLLVDARRRAADAALSERVEKHLHALAGEADVIVCTCSTLGEEIERLAGAVCVPVIRVDRPMAEAAVRAGGRLLVVAALDAALASTRALLRDCAEGLEVDIAVALCSEAWSHFEAGDTEAYLSCVAERVRASAADADVIVLGQASMADVVSLVGDIDAVVLSSPRSAVEAAIGLVRRGAYRDFERDGWQRAAANYATSFERVTGAYAGEVVDALDLSSGQRLLDVACGAGILVREALDRDLDTIGVDFSERMVAAAQSRHAAADIRQADAEQLPLADEYFDGVAVNFGILHFGCPLAALAEARRVLRPGGRIAFTVWACPEENRLQGEVFDAMTRLGGSRPALPPPPGGLVQSSAACRRLLADAGFEGIATRRERRMIDFIDSEQLLSVLEEGTVQTSSAISELRSDERAKLARSLQGRLSTGRGDNLEVASVAWLATATKPA